MYRPLSLLILCLFAFTSCKLTEHAIDLSLEFNRQQYKIKGSKVPSRNAARPGLNMALLWSENIDRVLYDKGPEDDASTCIPDNAIASSGNELSSFNFSSKPSRSFEDTRIPAGNNFPKEIYAMGGLELVLKASDDAGEKINLFYFEVPLYALYMKELPHGKIYGGLGPWFAYGLGGKSEDMTGGSTQKFNSFDKDVGFKRFDAGLGITAGYSFGNGFNVRLDYSPGFVNIGRENEKITNKTFGLHGMYTLK